MRLPCPPAGTAPTADPPRSCNGQGEEARRFPQQHHKGRRGRARLWGAELHRGTARAFPAGCKRALPVSRTHAHACGCTHAARRPHKRSHACTGMHASAYANWGLFIHAPGHVSRGRLPPRAHFNRKLQSGFHSLHVVWCLLHVACCMLRVARCVLHLARFMLQVACCMVYVARCVLHAAWCMLPSVSSCGSACQAL